MNPFTGGCACGAIRYECSEPPLRMLNCHCRDCQVASGSAYSPTLIMASSAVNVTRGLPARFEKTAESGNTASRAFCRDCGTPLFASSSAGAEYIGVRAASLDDPRWFRPEANVWVRSAQPWDHLDPAIPAYERNRPRESGENAMRGDSLEIRPVRAEEVEEARMLLTQEPGWAARFRDPESFRRLIARSQRALVAVESGRVVGFVRAITDDMSNGYLTLLIVRKGHRGKGIGRALVRSIVGENTAMTWVLRADRGAQGFYERIGFVRSAVAMERPRARAPDE